MEELGDYLVEAVFMEMVDEDIKIRDAFAIRNRDFSEDLREEILEMLINLKADEAHHSYRFLKKADRVDLDIDFHQLYRRAFPEPEGEVVDKGIVDILRDQYAREQEAMEFYREAAEGLRSRGGADELAVARVFAEVSRDEENHARRIKVLIDKAEEV